MRIALLFVVSGGTVVEEGTHDDLCALGGVYHSLMSRQLEPADAALPPLP